MTNNSRFEEHNQHEHDADIEQYRSRCEDLDQFEEEENKEMCAQYEMEQMTMSYHRILGEIVSVENNTMYVQNMRKINLMGNIVTEYSGIVTPEDGNSYYKDSWLSNTVMYSDTAIDFLEERINWFDKTTLVPVQFRNDIYRYYTLMSLEAYLIQTEQNYMDSEPAYLFSLEELESNRPKQFHPDYQDIDSFIDDQLYIDHLIDVANGNDYEGEYNLNYESYRIVVSQFDSCDFYTSIEYKQYFLSTGPYDDDDLPF